MACNAPFFASIPLLPPSMGLLTLACLWCLPGVYHGIAQASEVPQDLHPRQVAPATPQNTSIFTSRAWYYSIVVGDYLYIDGGEVNFRGNGRTTSLPDNYTYSIDLKTSWDNSTMTFNRIPKTAPIMNHVTLWKEPSGRAFYAYGGEQSYALGPSTSPPLPPNSLWRFVIDGNSGSWFQVTMSADSIFPSLVRPAIGIGAYGGELGLLLGGVATSRTSQETASWKGIVPVPGLLSYDMTSGVWQNDSATGFSTYGTAMYGQMEYVPNLGEQGLFVVMGGTTSDLISWADRGFNLISFRTVSIYNPSSKSWHRQTTSGNIPHDRTKFCSVGFPGDNGTYEIFIFGGFVASTSGDRRVSASEAEMARNNALNEVFVLTLPGFSWQKANNTPTHPRIDHTCNLVGKRQMVVIGGINPASRNASQLIGTPDIWTNGIGIFVLSEMEWKSSYRADAAYYTTPAVVQRWYQQNGRYPSTWDDSRVRAYFTGDGSNSTRDDRASSTDSGPSNNAGVIAGSVIGGVAFVVLLGGALWVYLRHRRWPQRQTRSSSNENRLSGTIPVVKPELAADGASPPSYSKLTVPVNGIESTSVVEAEGIARYEMQG